MAPASRVRTPTPSPNPRNSSGEVADIRVVDRVANGGHDVPEDKVRARCGRLWRHLRDAIALSDEARVYDNSKAAEPFRLVASYINGQVISSSGWPSWTPRDLRDAGY